MSTTFEKTWQQLGNQPMTTSSATNCAKNQMWWFKAFLMGQLAAQSAWTGKWSMYYSCDGTTAGSAGDGVDRWTSTFDPTKLVNAASASPHSWAVLTKTIGGLAWYVTLDYNNGNAYQASFGFSHAAPTGGDASNRPTATDEVFVSTWQATQFNRFSSTTQMAGLLATDGSFAMLGQEPGNNLGVPQFGWLFQLPQGIKTADTWPACMWLRYSSGNPWLRATFADRTYWGSRTFDGTTFLRVTTLRGSIANSDPFFGSAFGGIPDAADGLWADLPIYLVNSDSGAYTRKGRLADFKWAPESLVSGFIEPNPSAPASMVFGNLWTPWAFVANL